MHGPNGRHLLATTRYGATVRIWDPDTAADHLTVPIYRGALCVCAVDGGRLAVGLSAGILVLDLAL